MFGIVQFLLLLLGIIYIIIAVWSRSKNPYSLTYKYLYITYLLAGFSYIINLISYILINIPVLYVYLFRLTIALTDLAILCLSIPTFILIHGEAFFTKKVKRVYIIVGIILMINSLFYPNGVVFIDNSEYRNLLMNIDFGLITIIINSAFLTITLINLYYLFNNLEKKLRRKPLILSLAIIFITIDMIVIAIIDMHLLGFGYVIIPFLFSWMTLGCFIVFNLKI
ncbi:MAG: hypothetical protein ACTSRZ_14550 [Promethearchaeota archaeon]